MEEYRLPGAVGKNSVSVHNGDFRQNVVISTKKLAKVSLVLHPLV
jgi:hypothetical protein